jgi:hypothetical protein
VWYVSKARGNMAVAAETYLPKLKISQIPTSTDTSLNKNRISGSEEF